MQGQNQISSLLSLGSTAEPARTSARKPEGGGRGEEFSRLLATSADSRAADRMRARRDDSRLQSDQSARRGADIDRSQEQRPQAERLNSGKSKQATAEPAGAERATRARDVDTEKRTSTSPDKTGDTSSGRLVNGEAVDAGTLLAQLSEEDLQALGDDVTALLAELHKQLEAGELDEQAQAALKDLMVALEEGAPVADIEALLQAIPVANLPAVAGQFPDARHLNDILGRTGAAYLKQLAQETGARQGDSVTLRAAGSETPSPAIPALAGESVELDKNDTLEKLLLGPKESNLPAGKEAFARLMQAAGRGDNPGGRAAEVVQNNTAASSVANLDAARQTPLQPTERQFTVQSEVRVPVGQAQWSQAVGQRVLWQAAQNISTAELRLDPPDLGPMQVRVTSHQDQISVTFTSAQPAVREALDQSAARLREMFAEQGLDLVDVNVSDQSDGRETAQGDGEGRGGRGDGGTEPEAETAVVAESLVSTYLVDHYA